MKKNRISYCIMAVAACTVLAWLAGTGRTEEKKGPPSAPRKIIAPPADWLDFTPVRKDRNLLFYLNTFYVQRCSECHVDFREPRRSHLPLGAHRGMPFNHGLNIRCFNCHNIADLETYVDHDGSQIPADMPVLLCRKCHGPTYRDWVAGTHGRLNGSWDPPNSLYRKLECNQCHNPHEPHFPLLIPMPAPEPAVAQQHDKEGRHE